MNGISQVKIAKNISTEPKVGKMEFDYLTILNRGKITNKYINYIYILLYKLVY